MNIQLIVDCQDIFPYMIEGTVIQEVRMEEDKYIGLFCSMFGSYTVEVPIDRCKKINKND